MPTQNRIPNLAATPNRFASGLGQDPRFTSHPNNFGTGSYFSAAPYAGAPRQDQYGNKVGPTKEEALAVFYGQPTRAVVSDPYLDRDNEVYDLPDAYRGKNSYLSLILITTIQEWEMWPLRELFPWMKWDKSFEVAWDEWHFNDHMLDREPEETAPRLLTSNFSERRATMVRYGIGLMLEHGFWRTEKGQKNYAMNMMQISNAVVETAGYGAIWTAVHSVPPKDRNSKYRSSTNRSRSDLDALFEEEHDMWAILQKPGSGFQLLTERADNAFNARNPGQMPNYFVLPQGTRKYVVDKEQARYWMLDSMPNRDPVAVAMAGRTYRESRPFRVGEHQPDDDPCISEQTIGSFNSSLFHHISDVPATEFRTSMQDMLLYDEARDDWVRHSFRDNVVNMGLFTQWESEKPPLSEIGEQFFSAYNTWGNYILESNKEAGDRVLEYICEGIDRLTNEQREKFKQAAHSDEGPQSEVPETQGRFEIGDGVQGRFDLGDYDADTRDFIKSIQEIGDVDLSNDLKALLNSDVEYDLAVDGWALLAPSLVQADIRKAQKACVAQSRRDHSFRLTQLEKTNNAESESASPHWLTKGPDADFCEIRVLSSLTEGSSLRFNSSAFTLSSQAFVAFELEEEDVRHLVKSKGSLTTTLASLKNDPIRHDVLRTGLLQVSSAASAVLWTILHGEDTKRVDIIRSILSRQHFLTRSNRDLNRVFEYAMTLPFLSSQRAIQPVLDATRHLLNEFYTNNSIADSQIDRLADAVIEASVSSGTGGALLPVGVPDHITSSTEAERKEARGKVEEAKADADKKIAAMGKVDPKPINTFHHNNEKWSRVFLTDKHDQTNLWDKIVQKATEVQNAKYATPFRKRQTMFSFMKELLDSKTRENIVNMNITDLTARYAFQESVSGLPLREGKPEEITAAISFAGIFNMADSSSELVDSPDAKDANDFYNQIKTPAMATYVIVTLKKNGFTFKRGLPPVVTTANSGPALAGFQLCKEALENVPSQQSTRDILLNTPIIDGAFIKFCLAHNVLCPLGMLCFRPHMTYLMGGGFATAAGGQAVGGAGNTLHGHSAFELSDDTTQMMHHGHFVTYNKTVIWESGKIVHLPNVLCKGYVCGNDVKVWNPLNDDHREMYKEGRLTRSMFVFPVPIGWNNDSHHLDITGSYNPELGASTEAAENTAYPSAFIATDIWGLDNNIKIGNDANAFVSPAFNTICFQAHQQNYNASDKKFSAITIEKTAWGMYVYPGCGRVRRGAELLFKPVDYDSTKTFMLV